MVNDASTLSSLRLGSPFDYGARGFNVNTLLPLVEFSKGDANQKFPFHFLVSREQSPPFYNFF
jgi:hypothetical protein